MDFPESSGVLVHQLAHALALAMERRLKTVGVTLSQWLVLKQLWHQEGICQVELQGSLNLERATVNGLIQRMVSSGLVVCQSNPADKRMLRIFLTERGRALKEITPAFEDEVIAHTFQGFSEDERLFFNRLLVRALDNTLGKEA